MTLKKTPAKSGESLHNQDATEPDGNEVKLSPVRAEPSLSFGPGTGTQLGIGEVKPWPHLYLVAPNSYPWKALAH